MPASRCRFIHVVLAIVLVHVIALSAQAVRIDGSWSGEAAARAAPSFPVVAVFKTNGKSLTGTISVDDAPGEPIRDGEIDGNAIYFVFSGFGGDIHAEGTVSAAEIKLKAPTEIGITFDIVLTRKK
jgi:hypothetical protein